MTGLRPPRSTARLWAGGIVAGLLFAALVALGTWQVQRRAWKLDLIARVEQRVHAAPAVLPPPSRWAAITAASDEYRRVQATGVFLHELETPVQAVTDLGAGFWILTPLKLADGTAVLVNRGFVPGERRERASRRSGEPSGPTTVTGLLRISEPGGGFLRRNDAPAGRWYSRDVGAIAASHGLPAAAPYFVDADAATPGSTGGDQPVGGLTVIAFHNSHLVYAVTWYTLAAMVAGGAVLLLREGRRRRAGR